MRNVTKWETGKTTPSGPSEAVILALGEKVEMSEGAELDEFLSFILKAAAVGGLVCLLVKLFNSVPRKK